MCSERERLLELLLRFAAFIASEDGEMVTRVTILAVTENDDDYQLLEQAIAKRGVEDDLLETLP